MTQPRDLTIRPLSVGGMIDWAVALTVRHFRPLFLAMLLVQAPAFLLVRIAAARSGDLLAAAGDPAAFAPLAGRAAAAALALAAALLVLQFLATAAVAAIVGPTLAGGARPPAPPPRRALATLGAALVQLLLLAAAPALGALPGAALLLRASSPASAVVGLAGAALGALLLFLVALLRTLLAPAAAAVEGAPGLAALRRSSRLMAPRPGQRLLERPGVRASLLLLTTFVLALAVNGLASLPRAGADRLLGRDPLAPPGGLPLPLEVALSLLEVCAGAALQPFSLAAVAVFYFERRARTEGLDLEAWAARLGGPRR
jgi:hypothetical protein